MGEPPGREDAPGDDLRHAQPGHEVAVAAGGPELHRVVLAVAGRPRVAQDGRARRLEPGEPAIYYFARPYELDYDSPVDLAVVSFPHGSLALPPDTLAQLTALPVAGSTGTGALAERSDEADVMPAESQECALVLRVDAFIEQHLGEVGLDPATLAAAHYVSLRHLHRLFGTQGTTVAAWIRRRRLERCRADLADPALWGRPVSAVAARWGLADPAHFSRLFRRTYGMSPTEYRRAGVAQIGVPA